jgi:FixJ family two-component response regulator
MNIPTVFVVDDDPQMLLAITRVLKREGWATRSYRSAKDYLADPAADTPGCLVLDLLMPDMTGLDLQQKLARLGQTRPIVFLSGRGDISTSVRAMKLGAVDFLTKPVEAEALLEAVHRAIERDASERATASRTQDARDRFSNLTIRERQVLDGVVAGLLNKQIAANLGIVEKTVKVHRARAVAKMGVRSAAELVLMVEPMVEHRANRPRYASLEAANSIPVRPSSDLRR